MGKSGNKRWAHLAILGWCGFGLLSPALASPPIQQKAALHAEPRVSLDLRPSVAAMAAFENPPAAFPSGLHRQPIGPQEDIRLPSLGFESAQAPARGRAQEFVSHARREGLPIAKLWQNKSAMVSLGLNQRGKPGLWLVQKIH
jgi:hypothetical protein